MQNGRGKGGCKVKLGEKRFLKPDLQKKNYLKPWPHVDEIPLPVCACWHESIEWKDSKIVNVQFQ